MEHKIAYNVTREAIEESFLAYLESQRRQKIAELRDIEKHLIQYGRISKSALRPSRDR